MVNIIKLEDTDIIKNTKVSILLTYVDGCSACQMIKPKYEELSNIYPNLSFFKAEFNSIIPFYAQFADKTEQVETIKDEQGEPLLDENGNYQTKVVVDDNGIPILAPKIVVPNFFIFIQEEISDENPYGFVGGIDGADISTLEHTLEVLNENV